MDRLQTLSLTTVVALVVLHAVSERPRAQAAQSTPLIVGTWKLNTEKSNLRVPPNYVEIRQYSLRPDGYLVGLLITGTPQVYHYLQFVAKSDGKDYPEYSDQIVGDLVAAGKPTSRTYAERTTDEYVTEWTDKVEGRVTAQGKKIVSKDGMTLTISVDGAPAIRVYDRQ
jgi:hypothetical protein